jgi:hypothetical protein
MASPPLLTPTIIDLGGWLHKEWIEKRAYTTIFQELKGSLQLSTAKNKGDLFSLMTAHQAKGCFP